VQSYELQYQALPVNGAFLRVSGSTARCATSSLTWPIPPWLRPRARRAPEGTLRGAEVEWEHWLTAT